MSKITVTADDTNKYTLFECTQGPAIWKKVVSTDFPVTWLAMPHHTEQEQNGKRVSLTELGVTLLAVSQANLSKRLFLLLQC